MNNYTLIMVSAFSVFKRRHSNVFFEHILKMRLT